MCVFIFNLVFHRCFFFFSSYRIKSNKKLRSSFSPKNIDETELSAFFKIIICITDRCKDRKKDINTYRADFLQPKPVSRKCRKPRIQPPDRMLHPSKMAFPLP